MKTTNLQTTRYIELVVCDNIDPVFCDDLENRLKIILGDMDEISVICTAMWVDLFYSHRSII